jgi:hypothetical protein
MALNLRHQTAEQFAARYWARVEDAFRSGNKLEFCRLLWWLTRKLVAGDITDAQARVSYNTAFGKTLNATQWTNLRSSRITPAHDRYQAILDEQAI